MLIKKVISILIFCIFFVVLSCKSGSSELDIVGGEIVKDGTYPTVVLMQTSKSSCSGVIVSENVIITAAHCIIDYNADYSIKNNYVIIDNKKIYGSSYVWFDEFVEYSKKLAEEFSHETVSVDTIKELRSKTVAYDLSAIIFDNVNGKSPFTKLLAEARRREMFFQLSDRSFEDGTILQNNSKDIFFLGFGKYGSLDKAKEILRVSKNQTQEVVLSGVKQIGYNSFQYHQNINTWEIFNYDDIFYDVRVYKDKNPNEGKKLLLFYPELNNECVELAKDNVVKKVSCPAPGDSGGPLIYKNQIIGIASRSGVDAKLSNFYKVKYVSLTLGSEISKNFMKKVNNELETKKLSLNNSIFKKLSK